MIADCPAEAGFICVRYPQFRIHGESITLFWSPWGSKDSGCSKIKIAKVKACCYSTFTLAIYCFMDFATNVKKKKKKRPILLK